MSKNNKNQKWRELIDDIKSVAEALILLGSLYKEMLKQPFGKRKLHIKKRSPAENPLCKKSVELRNLYVAISQLEGAFNDFNEDSSFANKRKARARFNRQRTLLLDLLEQYGSERVFGDLIKKIKGSNISSFEEGWFKDLIKVIEQI